MTMDIKADLVVDTKGLECPRPLLKAKQTLEGMQAGQILEVISNDSTIKQTFTAYTRRSGDEILAIHEDGAVIHCYVRKGFSSR